MNPETQATRQHRHLGAYGVCVLDGYVLLIRKGRGPYTGLLDLPGGGLEFGEEPEAALRREFWEETGLTIQTASLRQAASKQLRHRSDDGGDEELHHVGLLYDVALYGTRETLPEPSPLPDGQDSNGAAWFSLRSTDPTQLTPFARLVLFEETESETANIS